MKVMTLTRVMGGGKSPEDWVSVLLSWWSCPFNLYRKPWEALLAPSVGPNAAKPPNIFFCILSQNLHISQR